MSTENPQPQGQEFNADAAMAKQEAFDHTPISEGVEHGPYHPVEQATTDILDKEWRATEAAAEGRITRDQHNMLRDESARAYEAARANQAPRQAA